MTRRAHAQSGQSVVLMAIALLTMLAALGLAIDGGFALYYAVKGDTAAAAAVAAGQVAMAETPPNPTEATQRAYESARLNGYPQGTPNCMQCSIVVSTDPLVVRIIQRFPVFLMQVMGLGPTITIDRQASNAASSQSTPPAASGVIPPQGPTSLGARSVSIVGTGLSAVNHVIYCSGGGCTNTEGTVTTVTVYNDTQVAVLLPAHPAGPVRLQACSPIACGGWLNYNYLPAATPTGTLIPSSGSAALGDRTVTIIGTGLAGVDSAAYCEQFSCPAAGAQVPYQVFTDSDAAVLLPPHQDGPVSVLLHVSGTPPGTYVNAGQYLYHDDPPVVDTLVPANGPVSMGARTISVFGSNFIGITEVRFCEVIQCPSSTQTVPFSVFSSREMAVQLPPRPPGSIKLLLTSTYQAGGPMLQNPVYSYTATTTQVTALSPSSGPIALGARTITVFGSGFTGLDGVGICDMGCPAAEQTLPYSVFSDREMAVQLPARQYGSVRITLHNQYSVLGWDAPGALRYQYTETLPTITGTIPASGPSALGARIVTVTGTGFSGVDSVGICDVGCPATNASVPYNIYSDREMAVQLPPRSAGSLVHLALHTPNAAFPGTMSGGAYSYTSDPAPAAAGAPVVASVYPNTYFSSGAGSSGSASPSASTLSPPVQIQLSGTNLSSGTPPQVTVNGSSAWVTINNATPTSLYFTVDQSRFAPGTYPIEVRTSATNYPSGIMFLTIYQPAPVVTSIYPNTYFSSGGTSGFSGQTSPSASTLSPPIQIQVMGNNLTMQPSTDVTVNGSTTGVTINYANPTSLYFTVDQSRFAPGTYPIVLTAHPPLAGPISNDPIGIMFLTVYEAGPIITDIAPHSPNGLAPSGPKAGSAAGFTITGSGFTAGTGVLVVDAANNVVATPTITARTSNSLTVTFGSSLQAGTYRVVAQASGVFSPDVAAAYFTYIGP